MSDLKIGAGYSAEGDTEAAVREAITAARRSFGAIEPKLVIVAATVDHDASRVDTAVRRELPSASVHGATTSLGVLGGDGVVMGAGGGVGVLLFASEGKARFEVGHATLEEGAREGGRNAAQMVVERGPAGERPRLLFVAATPGNEEDVLAGVAEVLPGVPVFGGSAADHSIEGAWSVFTDEGAMRSAVSLAAVFGDIKIGGAFAAPYEPTSLNEVVTETKGRSIVTLGGRPASAVLHEWIGEGIADQVKGGGNLLVQTALSPLGIPHIDEQGEAHYLLLHPAHAHPEGTVDLFAKTQTGTRLCLMRGSEESLIGIMDRLVDRSLKAAGLEDPSAARGAFLIYCAGCAGAVGSRITDVMARLRSRLGDVPVLGFCTFGEQGVIPGLGNVHSNLSVALVLAG